MRTVSSTLRNQGFPDTDGPRCYFDRVGKSLINERFRLL